MSDATLPTAIRTFAASRHYRPATLDRWLALPSEDAAAVLQWATELRLGENQLGDLWTWADEIARRDGLTVAAVLGAPALQAVCQRAVSRNDRLKLLKSELWRRRFPQLAAVEEKLQVLIQQLGLPRNVRIALPANLEGDRLTLAIDVDSAASLKAVAAELDRAAASPACAGIFALLGEAP